MSSPTLLAILPVLLGGVGLFLVGMILMSDGLKAAAGGSLQAILERFTGSTFSAFLSGVGLTALVQSSSATTVATIGFVSAGLLSFTASIGVIIGANVGTTSTGWIVSLLGLKLNVGAIALPLIGVGALLRLLSTGRRANLGMALAGFGLIVIGIDFLQEGMGGLAQVHLDQPLHFRRRLALLHASDHLDRLVEACLEHDEPVVGEQVKAAAVRLAPELAEAASWLQGPSRDGEDVVRHLAEASAHQAEERRRHRDWLLAETAAGLMPPDETQRKLESMRWVDRVGYHAWRALHHLAGADGSMSSEVYQEPETTHPAA